MDDLVKEFLLESHENLDQLDREFVTWEENPSDLERVQRIFRTIHSVKGIGGCLGFSKLEKVTHAAENLLVQLRDGKLALNTDMVSAMLLTVDAVRQILANIEASGTEGDGTYGALESLLNDLKGDALAANKPAQDPDWKLAAGPIEISMEADAPSGAAPKAEPAKPAVKPLGEILVDSGKIKSEQLAEAMQLQEEGDPRHIGEILVEKGAAKPAEIKDALQAQKSAQIPGGSVADTTLRVDVGLLDKLMNQIGELVLTRNHIVQLASKVSDPDVALAAQKLDRITSDLQEGLMKTRMQAIGGIWGKYPRLVRDLSLACGKQVKLTMEGKDTELDKSLIEALKDPLTHIVRNSVDHGIEEPEKRIAAGKPEEGMLALSAYHESGHVVVEITDDGKGLDPGKIKAKALEKGVISAADAARMSEREAINLIFLPGFSTAEKVTNVSGRGVGMDVVRTNIEGISGSIEIQSQVGKGTTLKIKLPLTLAIVPALVVASSGESYAIPQANLVELIRLEGDKRKTGIESIDGAPVYRLRGELLPLLDLREVLGIDAGASSKLIGSDEPVQFIVLQAEHRRFGMVVDRIFDCQEIVVKPLAKSLKDLQVFSGATILGTGRVALILDIAGMAARMKIANVEGQLQSHLDKTSAGEAGTVPFLVFTLEDASRMAVPLDKVVRLEKVPPGDLEKSGAWDVVQYRGGILPLLSLQRCFSPGGAVSENGSNRDEMQIVVYQSEGKILGLQVDSIVDIVNAGLDGKQDPTRDGVFCNAVIGNRVTEIVDVDSLIRAVDPEFFRRKPMIAEGAPA
jgi:two-component system chemotaxis sensor kinase CheA